MKVGNVQFLYNKEDKIIVLGDTVRVECKENVVYEGMITHIDEWWIDINTGDTISSVGTSFILSIKLVERGENYHELQSLFSN